MPARFLIASLAAPLALSIASGCSAEPSISPIGTNQSFTGYVNGLTQGAVVQTVCKGTINGEPVGFAVAGQTVSAALDPSGNGNTGDNGAVFVLPNTNAEFVSLRNWNEPVAFPTNIQVPCDGPGVIVFDPCFGFVGCRGAAKADSVKVTFQSVTD